MFGYWSFGQLTFYLEMLQFNSAMMEQTLSAVPLFILIGIMAARTMNRSGYDVRLSAGAITAGGTLGILILPSIMLVVMGPILELPVTDLFAAATIPGMMMAILYVGYALVRCSINPALAN